MKNYIRINSMEELERLEMLKDGEFTNILITKIFKFPENCFYLFESWCGNITFEEGIDTSNVENMNCMFFGCVGKIEGLEYFDVSNVENMSLMFYPKTVFDVDISNWNIREDCDVKDMFKVKGE